MVRKHFSSGKKRAAVGLAALTLAALTLSACQDAVIPKDIRPVSSQLVAEMKQHGMRETSPVFVRIFKEESELEIWKQRRDGQYALLKTYNICKWSGVLGPKLREGDRQAPEGFYTVTPSQMNPKSSYYLAFNIGYPNAFDRAHDRTGSHLMVHGACSSAGCYSMTDEDAGEIFALARDAFKGGQRAFQIQAFPFRMTPANLAKHRDNPNIEFWRMLKVGYDHFEVTHRVPKVDVCNGSYVFNAEASSGRFVPTASCPAFQIPPQIAAAVAAKQTADDKAYANAVASAEAAALALAEEQRKAEERAAAEAVAEAAKAAAAEQRAAEKTAAAEARAAAKAAAAEERAAAKAAAASEPKKPFLSRILPSGLFGRGKKQTDEPGADDSEAEPPVSPETTATPSAPRTKPDTEARAAPPKPNPAVETASAPPLAAPAPAATKTAAVASAQDAQTADGAAGGKKKRNIFFWANDSEDAVAAPAN